MTDPHVKVRLVISDFLCEPEDISRILGLDPTKIWRAGEKVHPRAVNVHKQNGWMLSSPAGDSASMEEQIVSLFELIDRNRDSFRNLPLESQIELSCVVYAYNGSPAVNIPSRIVAFLASLKGSIDIDMYCFPDEDKEDRQTAKSWQYIET